MSEEVKTATRSLTDPFKEARWAEIRFSTVPSLFLAVRTCELGNFFFLIPSFPLAAFPARAVPMVEADCFGNQFFLEKGWVVWLYVYMFPFNFHVFKPSRALGQSFGGGSLGN